MATFALYPYQQECLNHAISKNTICNLPTGYGKTLIAVKLIEYYLKECPNQRVAFLVPTRPLVEQQSEYCRSHCRLPCGTFPKVEKLVGQDQVSWQQSDWDNCMKQNHILLGTAALFQQAFVTDRRISIGRISLIVFDECHNATGNSPMAVVMRDAIAPYKSATGLPGPRILGLTASFVNGSTKDLDKKRRSMEALLLSTMYCPLVDERIHDDRFLAISWAKTKNEEASRQAIEGHIESAINHIGKIKEITKVVRRCLHVFDELGYVALMHYIKKVIVEQIAAKAALLKEQGEDNTIRCAATMLNALPCLKIELSKMQVKIASDPLVQECGKKSLKVNALIDLLHELFHVENTSYSGIVFVEQVALVSSLAKVLNDSMISLGVRCGAVAGTGYQSESDRRSQLDLFRSGDVRILASTAALEEGIDVSSCAFVVRYSSVATTKAHVQGAGRARHPNAMIYYFENNPRVERQKEANMLSVARNMSLSLGIGDLQDAVTAISISPGQKHPYPFGGRQQAFSESSGEVNVFNAKQIFNQYCSITLGLTVQPKTDLYQYRNEPGAQKLLSKIRFPTPDGWRSISHVLYKSFWEKTDMDQIVSAKRSKRKTQSEKEEMCFVYIAVVLLREGGLLDIHNRPDVAIRVDVKRNCDLTARWSDTISIKNAVFQSYR